MVQDFNPYNGFAGFCVAVVDEPLDMESTQIVTMHIQSVDQTAAIKTIKRIITELDRSKIEEQKKAVRSGYDMDIIPVSYTHLDVYKRQQLDRAHAS